MITEIKPYQGKISGISFVRKFKVFTPFNDYFKEYSVFKEKMLKIKTLPEYISLAI